MKKIACCLLPLLPLLYLANPVKAEDGVPELLRFAEEYQRKSFSGEMNLKSVSSENFNVNRNLSSKGTVGNVPRQLLQQRLTAHKEQLARQQVTIQEQRKQLVELNKALYQLHEKLRLVEKPDVAFTAKKNAESHIRPEEYAPLMQLVTRFRHALGGAPDELRLTALLKDSRTETAQIKIALSESNAREQALKQRLEEQNMKVRNKLDGERGEHIKAVTDLKTQLSVLQGKRNESDAALAKLKEEHRNLQDDIKQLRQRAGYRFSPEALRKPAYRQTYAAGTALGQEILDLLAERKSWGVNVDSQIVLAGISDTFSGRFQLSKDELRIAMAESEEVVKKARETADAEQKIKGETFIASFKKQKGAQQSPSGFWYRIGYVGDSPIADNAIVEVVVKESLTDGTVIQDMDLSGKVLSQEISAYPALFREAISYLHNHGSVTLVVPPALAYGEVGYPPKIPSQATMVYELRIADVKESAEKPIVQ